MEFKIGDKVNGLYDKVYVSKGEAEAAKAELIESASKDAIADHDSSLPYTLGDAIDSINDHFFVSVVPWKLTPLAEDAIVEFGNYDSATVDSDGDVWVENANGGFWLDDDILADFCNWVVGV